MAQPKRPPVFREDGTIQIRLTKGYAAIVDAADAALAQLNWHATVAPDGRVYAQRRDKFGAWLLHREVLGLKFGDDLVGDHRDGNTLDCRRHNLRAVTEIVNRRNRGVSRSNRSGFVGVHRVRKTGRWRASLDCRSLGDYDTAEEANEARLAAERRKWGIEPRRAAAHDFTP